MPLPAGYGQITDLTAVRTLQDLVDENGHYVGLPSGVTRVVLQAETVAVRYRDDGLNPAAAVGLLIPAGTSVVYDGPPGRLKFFQSAATARLNVLYYREGLYEEVALSGLAAATATYVASPNWCFADAAGTVPCGNGDKVALWKDEDLVAGFNLAQAVEASRPTLRSYVNGNKNFWAVDFAGAQRMAVAFADLAQPNTVGVAFRAQGAGTRVVYDGVTIPRQFAVLGTGVARINAGANLDTVALVTDDWRAAVNVYNGVNSAIYLDGVSSAAGDAGAGAGAGDGMHVGATNAGASFFTGQVAAIVLSGRRLAASRVAALSTHLRRLVGELP